MKSTLSLLVAALVGTTGVALATGVPAAAETSGSFSPTTIDAGETFTVTMTVELGDDAYVCEDNGPDEYIDEFTPLNYGVTLARPMVVAFWAGDISGDPSAADNEPTAWLTLDDLTGYTHPDTTTFGWVGDETMTGTLPDLEPGTYTAGWGCGYPETDYTAGWGYIDGDALAFSQVITVPAEAAPTAIDLELELILDKEITGGALGVPVSGAGLLPGADYQVVLRSDPVTIGTGIVDENGEFSATYPIPADTPDGGHSVTVSSLDPDGKPVEAVGYFNLEGGVVTGVSYETPYPEAPGETVPTTAPEALPIDALPPTGGSALPLSILAAALVIGGLALRRRTA